MRARWGSFALGLWLILAPLVLGYPTVTAVLHEIALGLLVCVATLAALEWPIARFAVTLPAIWLIVAGHFLDPGSARVTANEVVSGTLAFILALIPSASVATARRPAKMVA
jgi:hypothetical protein